MKQAMRICSLARPLLCSVSCIYLHADKPAKTVAPLTSSTFDNLVNASLCQIKKLIAAQIYGKLAVKLAASNGLRTAKSHSEDLLNGFDMRFNVGGLGSYVSLSCYIS